MPTAINCVGSTVHRLVVSRTPGWQVITGGPSQKFGHPIEAMAEFAGVARAVGATVVGACCVSVYVT